MHVKALQNRIRAMNSLYRDAVADMTLEQVNHQEREKVLPIAFSLSHFMRAQDQSISGAFLREQTAWEAGGWAAKVGVTVDRLGKAESVEEMEQLRFGDFEAWKQFQAEVLRRTDAVLDTLTDELLAEVVMERLPESFGGSYIARVIGTDAPVRKLDVLECFVYQHGLRHMGEIEHGRALVGLGGMTT